MNELSLFSGAGGGLLGTKLLGWRHVGYVEYERYCQQVIAQRIKDGFLDEAPIFGDIDHFIESGASKKYAGFVDVVTAGFPCQPFSVAGKRKGKDDSRNKWPQTIQCIRDIRPRYALLENVSGLLNSGYFPEILRSLAQARYDAKWIVLGADDVGAPHRRKRLWIKATMADTKSEQCNVSDNHTGVSMEREQVSESGDSSRSGRMAATSSIRLEEHGHSQAEDVIERGKEVPNTSSERLEGWESSGRESEEHSSSSGSCWWSTEPNVGRVAHGLASRVDRLKALGNGQSPAVVAAAWEILA